MVWGIAVERIQMEVVEEWLVAEAVENVTEVWRMGVGELQAGGMEVKEMKA